MIKLRHTIIFSGIFFILGIVSWIIGGGTNRVVLMYTFPRCAINVVFMFFFWGFSFIYCGAILAGTLFGCKKYIRHKAYKSGLYIIIMQLFTLMLYPLFFGAIAPFITLLANIVALLFCLLSIISSYRIYSLWTICLCLHFLWLFYNSYVCLAFIFIN